MSDSRRVYLATKQAISQLYPAELQGNLARHLNTLAGMVTGIVLSKSCQLPKMAAKAPDATLPDSREKRFVSLSSCTKGPCRKERRPVTPGSSSCV